MTSRHNISFSDALFRGRAVHPFGNQGKPGTPVVGIYRWKPTGNRPITFAAPITAGSLQANLNAVWAGPSGLYLITFSDGSSLMGLFTNGALPVLFYPNATPARSTLTNPNYGNPMGCNAVTASAVAAGLPPVASIVAAYAASQAVAAGASALFNANVGYSGNVLVNGSNVNSGIPDVPRNVVAAWTGAATLTITGLDYYGLTQTETQTGTSFTGKKAFLSIQSAVFSAAVTAATVGFGNALGLPVKVLLADFFAQQVGGAPDAGTLTLADITSPATSTTGDVRGTYAVGTALTGANFLGALMHCADSQTQFGAYGCVPA